MRAHSRFVVFIVILAGVMLTLTLRPAPADQAVRAAWNRALAVPGYRFATDLTQDTLPQAGLANLGRQTETQSWRLEGAVDTLAQALDLRLWANGGQLHGGPLTAEPPLEVQVRQGVAQARTAGADWQTVEGLTDLAAPNADPLAYLSAARNVRVLPADPRFPGTRYAFDLHGPTFAATMRDVLARQYQQRGELPVGASLDLPETYRAMTGSGELWVDERGLPFRQRLDITLPQADSVVRASLQSDFTFGAVMAPPDLALIWLGVARAWPMEPVTTFWLAAVTALAGWLLTASATPARRRAFSVSLSALLIVLPALQSVQTARAVSLRAERETRQQTARAEQTAQREAYVEAHTPRPAEAFQVVDQVDPFAPQKIVDDVPRRPLALDSYTYSAQDADKDGLADQGEAVLGTNPAIVDSDGDGLSDGDEVNGFVFNTVRYYLDPLEADSNNDGRADGLECPNFPTCPDTDGDGIPDVLDADDDNDGVPDRLDISPVQGGTAFSFNRDNPFQLSIRGLRAGLPTFVNFQVRPTNPNRLWYAFNVLDWPQGDNAGNIRDVDGATFASVNPASADVRDTYGDMRLVPTLEIILKAEDNLLPDAATQALYGLSVRPLTERGEVAVYVPLSLVSDPATGQYVAFSGKMVYLPRGSWQTQKVRLTWTVQMLVDNPPALNQLQVVQVYYDDFTLVGLSLREDNGAALAMLYEDPAADLNPQADDTLILLSQALDATFLAARDCDTENADGVCVGNGQRDITPAELARRFDRLTNAAVPLEQRWGLSNTLRVLTQTFPHVDALQWTVAQTLSRQILTSAFTPAWSPSAPVTPTLMMVREERFRAANMDVLSLGGVVSSVTRAGSVVTFDLAQDTSVQTLGAVNWSPYRYNGSEWRPYAVADYAAHELPARHRAQLTDPGDDSNLVAGRLALLQAYYLALSQGVFAPLDVDSISRERLRQASDTAQFAAVTGAIKLVGTGARTVINYLAYGLTNAPVQQISNKVLRYIGAVVSEVPLVGGNLVQNLVDKGLKAGLKSALLSWRTPVVGLVIVGAALLVVSLLILKLTGQDRAFDIALNVVMTTVTVAMSVLVPMISILKYAYATFTALGGTVKALFTTVGGAALAGQALARTFSAGLEVFRVSIVSAVIALVLQVGLAIGVFIAQLSSGVQAGSIEANQMAARLIADIYIAFVFFALSLTVYGALLVGLIAAVDALLGLLCKVGVAEACFTITGTLAQAISMAFYNFEATIETTSKLSNREFVMVGPPSFALQSPADGLRAGNVINVAVVVTSNVRQGFNRDYIHPGVGERVNTLFTVDTLRSATIRHALNATPAPAELNQMRSAWQNIRPIGEIIMPVRKTSFDREVIYRATRYGGTAVQTVQAAIVLQAGVNVSVPLQVNTAYALPAYECWGLGFIVSCKDQVIKGSASGNDFGVALDVFPATLDQLVSGAWGLPLRQFDRDGDGLTSQQVGGFDVNDLNPDSDGDGLSDKKEIELRAQGVNVSPFLADSDGDGLNDGRELQLGTRPDRADTDGDGLTDAEEVNGWTLTYGYVGAPPPLSGLCRSSGGTPLTTRVTSDPLQADTDGDGILDRFERDLHLCDPIGFPFSPRVENDNPLSVVAQISDADGFVAPGQAFDYQVFVSNQTPELNPLNMRGALTLTRPASAFAGPHVFTNTFDLWRGASLSRTVPMQILPGAGLQTVNVGALAYAALYSQTVSGGLFLSQDRPTTLIVDPNPPTSTVASFAPNGYFRAGATAIIGGLAADPTSYITRVQVSLNNGAWFTATGNEVWTYALPVPALEGRYPLDTRATDAVGNQETIPARRFFHADGTPPNPTSSLPNNTITAARQVGTAWQAPLFGTVTDPLLPGGFFGSGPAYVEARLIGASVPVTGAWQRAPAQGSTWAMTYTLPAFTANGEALGNPTGVYTLQLRAADAVDNLTAPGAETTYRLRLDNTPPAFTLVNPAPDTSLDLNSSAPITISPRVISQVMPFTGTVFDVGLPLDVRSGVNNVSLTFTPADLGVAPGMWRAWYRNNLTGFGAPDVETVSPDVNFTWPGAPLSGINPDNFSVDWQREALFRVSGAYTFTLQREAGAGGLMRAWLNGEPILFANDAVTQATAVLTATAGVHTLRVFYAHTTGAAQPRFEVRLRDSFPVTTVVTPFGQDVYTATWSHVIPANFEGMYQIGISGEDVLGNRAVTPNFWRGEIDTAPPRASVDVNYIGIGPEARTIYSVRVSDFNLTRNGYVSPCGNPRPEDLYYYQTEWWGEWFNDPTRLYEIYQVCTRPAHIIEPPRVRACDANGLCTDTTGTPPGAPNTRSLYWSTSSYIRRTDLNTGNTEIFGEVPRRCVVEGMVTTCTVLAPYDMVVDSNTGMLMFFASNQPTGTVVSVHNLNEGTHYSYDLPYSAANFNYDPVEGRLLYIPFGTYDGQGEIPYSNVMHSVRASDGGDLRVITFPHRIGTYAFGFDPTTRLLILADGEFDRVFPQPTVRTPDSYRMRFARLDGTFLGYIGDPTTTNYLQAGLTIPNRPAFGFVHDIAIDPLSRQIFWWTRLRELRAAPLPANLNAINNGFSLPAQTYYTSSVLYQSVPLSSGRLSNYQLRLDLPNNLTPTLKLYYAPPDQPVIYRQNISNTLFVSQEPVITNREPGGEIFFNFALDVNHLPIVRPQALVVDYNTPLTFTLPVTDTDLNQLRYRVLITPQYGVLSSLPVSPTALTVTLVYTPNLNFFGNDRFDYEVNDNRGGVVSGTVQIRVRGPLVLESSVAAPLTASVFATGDPIPVTLAANASEGVKTIALRVNGAPVVTSPNLGGPLSAIWSTAWTPASEGLYLLDAVVTDIDDQVQTQTVPTLINVAFNPPSLALGQTVYTSAAALLNPGTALLAGSFTASADPRAITVTVTRPSIDFAYQGLAAAQGNVLAAPYVLPKTIDWTFPVEFGYLPDNEIFNVNLHMVDAAGRAATLNRTARVDLAPPAPFTVTAGVVSGTTFIPLENFGAWRLANPTLQMTWTATSDNAGLAGYRAEWSQSPLPGAGVFFAPAATRVLTAVAGEAQIWYAHVTAQDLLGNRRTVTAGPFYIDAPTTPDLTALTVRPTSDFTGSGLSRLTTDAQAVRNNPALTQTQSVFATWDADAVRVAWQGFDLNTEGEAFFYFDTQAGGTRAALNPWASPTSLTLPEGFLADRLVWAHTALTATLYAWDGSAWQFSRALTASEFTAYANLAAPRFDVRLTRAELGLAGGLGLLAVATDETALRVWATAPNANPLNASRAFPLGRPLADHITATHAFRWDALPAGAAPNAGLVNDGVFLGDLRAAFSRGVFGREAAGPRWLDYPTDLTAFLAQTNTLGSVGRGRPLTFTLNYVNPGPATLAGVALTLTAEGALTVAGAGVVNLPPLPPNTALTLTLPATTTASGAFARLTAQVRDGTRPAYDFWTAAYVIDDQGPVSLTVTAPLTYIRPLTNLLQGEFADLSGASVITLEMQYLPGGTPFTQRCPVPPAQANSGLWVCYPNVGALAGAEAVQFRLQAEDIFGNVSAWTAPITRAAAPFVDSIDPQVILSAESLAALTGGYFNAAQGRIGLTGVVSDNRQAGRLLGCTRFITDTECAAANRFTLLLEGGAVATWTVDIPFLQIGDGVTQVVELSAEDEVGNVSAPLTWTARVDTVAPVLTATANLTTVFDVAFGAVPVTALVAHGTAADGAALGALRAWLIDASGTLTAFTGTLMGNAWALSVTLPAGAHGVYTLRYEMWDAAGNIGQTREAPVFFAPETARLLLTKTATPTGTVAVGQPLTYTLVARNVGVLTTTSATLTDFWPPMLETPVCAVTAGACAFDNGVATAAFPALAPGQAHTLTLSANVPAALPNGTTIVNTAVLSAPEITAPFVLTLTAATTHTAASTANLEMTYRASEPFRVAHDPLTYTLLLTNTGPSRAQTQVITTVLPANFTVLTATASHGECALDSLTFVCALNRPVRVLLVNDSQAQFPFATTNLVRNALSGLNYTLDTFTVTTALGNGPTAGLMLAYDVVIWSSLNSGDINGVGPNDYDLTQLRGFMANGGRLMLFTSWYGGFTNPVTGDLRPAVRAFLTDTLGVGALALRLTYDPAYNGGFTGQNLYAGANLGSSASAQSTALLTPNAGGTVSARWVDSAGTNNAGVYTPRTAFFGFALLHASGNPATARELLVRSLQTLFPPTSGGLRVGERLTVTVGGFPAVPGTYVATAHTSASNAAPVPGQTVTVTVGVSTALQLSQALARAQFDPLETITFSLRVTNAGPNLANNLVLTNPLPLGVSFTAASASGLACAHASGVVTCTAPALAVGASAHALITATAISSGAYVNTAYLRADEITGRSAAVPFSILGTADVAAGAVSVSPAVVAGQPFTLSVPVSNAGPNAALGYLVVSATVPVTWQACAASLSVLCQPASGAVFTAAMPNFASATSGAVTFTVLADAETLPGTVITAQAYLTSATTDPAPANNAGVPVSFSVQAQTALTLSVEAQSASVNPGEAYTLYVQVTALGPTAGHDLRLTLTAPPTTTLNGVTSDRGRCGTAGNSALCTFSGKPRVLVVDDDGTMKDHPFITPLLTGLGYDWTLYQVDPTFMNPLADGPSLAVLRQYDVVLWLSDGHSLMQANGPTANDEAALTAYLNLGGRLILSSRNYLDARGLSPFVVNVLGVQAFLTNALTSSVLSGVNAYAFLDQRVTPAPDVDALTLNPALAQAALRVTAVPHHVVAASTLDGRAVFFSNPVRVMRLLSESELEAAALDGILRRLMHPPLPVGQPGLGPQASLVVTFTAPLTGGALAHAVTVSATGAFSQTLTGTVTVRNLTALTLTHTGLPAVFASQLLTHTVHVANTSPNAALSPTVMLAWNQAVFDALNAPGWTCAPLGLTAACTRASLSASDTLTLTLTAPGDAAVVTVTSVLSASNSLNAPAGTASTTILPFADVVLSASAPSLVVTEQPLTYTLVVTNLGANVATGVVITGFSPLAFAAPFVCAGAPCTASATAFTATLGTLAVGQSRTLTVSAPAPATLTDFTPLTVTLTAGHSGLDTDPANSTLELTTTLRAAADLAVQVLATDPLTLVAGAPITYTMVLTNTGLAATPVTLTVQRWLDLFFSDPVGDTLACAAPGATCASAGDLITYTFPTLAVNQPVTATFTLLPRSNLWYSDEYVHVAALVTPTLDELNGVDNSVALSLPVFLESHVALSLSLSITSAQAPDTGSTPFTAWFTATNLGPSFIRNGLVTFTVPQGMGLDSTPAGCFGPEITRTNCQLFHVPVGGSLAISAPVSLYPPINGLYPGMVAALTAVADVPANLALTRIRPTWVVTTATVQVEYSDVLSVSATLLTPEAPVGELFTVEVRFTNPATDTNYIDRIVFTYTIPPEAELEQVQYPSTFYYLPFEDVCGIQGNQFICPDPASSWNFYLNGGGVDHTYAFLMRFRADVPASAMHHQVRATGRYAPPVSATLTVSTSAPLRADVGLRAALTPTLITAPGAPLTWTLVVSNAGPRPVTGVTLAGALAEQLTFTGCASEATYTCTVTAETLTVTVAPLAVTGAYTLTVYGTTSATLPLTATLPFTFAVTGASLADDVTANNSAAGALTVRLPHSDVSLALQATPALVRARGEPARFDVRLSNAGPDAAWVTARVVFSPAWVLDGCPIGLDCARLGQTVLFTTPVTAGAALTVPLFAHLGLVPAQGQNFTVTAEALTITPVDVNPANHALLTVTVPAAPPAPGQTDIVDVDSDELINEGDAFGAALSADGRYVVFKSSSDALVLGDTNFCDDVFLRDMDAGTTMRVSMTYDGLEANGCSGEPNISGDGRYVVYVSEASNLVPDDTNNATDLFRYDRQTGAVVRVNVTITGGELPGVSLAQPAISFDGRYIAFTTDEPLVITDTNGWGDVYVKDMVTGDLTLVSVSSAGAVGDLFSLEPTITFDGRYVAFESYSTLAPDDTNDKEDIYVHDRQTGQTVRASVTVTGAQGANMGSLGGAYDPHLAGYGRYVVFWSFYTNLVVSDTNNTADAFVKDLETGAVWRVSVGAGGLQANNASDKALISADGRFVVFGSEATNLAPNDTNNRYDIFVHDRLLNDTGLVSVRSDGVQANDFSRDQVISADARYVAFVSSATNLAPLEPYPQFHVYRFANLTTDLALSKAAARAGTLVTYTLTITNNGPRETSASRVFDPLPAGLTLGGCVPGVGFTCEAWGRTLVVAVGPLAAGQARTLAFTATLAPELPPGMVITNVAYLNAPNVSDLTQSNNTASAAFVLQEEADLSAALSVSPVSVLVGAAVTHTLTLTNLGPDTAIGVQAVTVLSAGLTFAGCAGATCTVSGQQVTLTFGALASGQAVTATLRVTPTVAGTYTTTVSAVSATLDPVSANNTASAGFTAQPVTPVYRVYLPVIQR